VHLDLKAHLMDLATSKQVKELVCDLVDNYVQHSDNKIDDHMAAGLRAAMFDDAGA
jgi:hypothetical protein